MKRLLSHPLRQGDPGWPGNPTLAFTPHESMADGADANTCVMHLFNHFGTHFDAPLHFNPGGKPIAALPFEDFFYAAPLLLDIPRGPCEKIEPEQLIPHSAAIASCDLLLLRTGFEANREKNPDLYAKRGPAVSSRTAKWLVETHPHLKAIGLDFLSLASYADGPDGVLAHQTILGMYHDAYICIIEDLHLAGLPAGRLGRAAAIPLLVEGVDSGPVTMWVEE